MAAADARQSGAGRLVAERHPDQHPRRGRRGRRHEDGPARVDRHVPRVADRRRHADQQQRARRAGNQPADGPAQQPGSTQPIRGRPIRTGTSSAGPTPNDFTEPTFRWDIFALCGDPANPAHGSTIVGDKFGSPDGLYVAPSGRLWIQTDVSGSTINSGRLRRLRQQPDALRRSDEPERSAGSWSARNFCEVTGVFVTPDEKTMFVGIQHPGEAPTGANDPANPEAVQFVAGWRGRRTSALVLHRDHERRRRTDRELKRRGRRRTRARRRPPLQSGSSPSRNPVHTVVTSRSPCCQAAQVPCLGNKEEPHMRQRVLTLALVTIISAATVAGTNGPNYDGDRDHRDSDHDRSNSSIQLGPRPFFLVEDMKDSSLKRRLQSCSAGPFTKSDFSIGHRGAALQFPEHTRESYEAGARMGAGILECDVTFTKDSSWCAARPERPAHHDQYSGDAAGEQCTRPFTPAVLEAERRDCHAGERGMPDQRLTLAEFKTLRGKMDAFNPAARTPQEFVGGTANFRTDLYSGPTSGHLMTHRESIELFKSLGVKMTPELKSPTVSMPFDGFTQRAYAQKMINDTRLPACRPGKFSRSRSAGPTSCTGSSTSRRLAGRRCTSTTRKQSPICRARRPGRLQHDGSTSGRRRPSRCWPSTHRTGSSHRRPRETPKLPVSTSSPGRSSARAFSPMATMASTTRRSTRRSRVRAI